MQVGVVTPSFPFYTVSSRSLGLVFRFLPPPFFFWFWAQSPSRLSSGFPEPVIMSAERNLHRPYLYTLFPTPYRKGVS